MTWDEYSKAAAGTDWTKQSIEACAVHLNMEQDVSYLHYSPTWRAPLTLAKDDAATRWLPPLDEEGCASISSNFARRNDSAVEFVPPLNTTFSYKRPEIPRGSPHFVYPPLIAGHGYLIKARQTVPAWIGALLVIGGFAWFVLCALYV